MSPLPPNPKRYLPMKTMMHIMNQVWCLCTSETKDTPAATPAAAPTSLWQWYRSHNAELAERGASAELPPPPRRRLHF